MLNTVNIYDRIKELSYTTGTGNFDLGGAANGFSSFSSVYAHNDKLFYAITDGTRYEIGSGIYITGVSGDELQRFPFSSTTSNGLVNFPAGLKEVFVTYPATHSVYNGSGIQNFSTPQKSGVVFWQSSNMLNYDSSIVWDSGKKRLGILNSEPDYGLQVGGNSRQSSIGASGFYVGSSGILFPSGNNGDAGYAGGRQLAHFELNQLGDANTQAILELSGVVDNIIFFKQQNAGTFLAGPPSGCSPPCSPALPSYRQIVVDDLPDLSGLYPHISQKTISSSSDAGIKNELAYDNQYFYIYLNPASGWRRISLGSSF